MCYRNVSIICAVAKNGAIGINGASLVRDLPDDRERFISLTRERNDHCKNVIIMGRLTAAAIKEPLAHCVNLVVTSKKDFHLDGFAVCPSLKDAVAEAQKLIADNSIGGGVSGQVFIIGGSTEMMREALNLAYILYLTEIAIDISDADSFLEGNCIERLFPRPVFCTRLMQNDKGTVYRMCTLKK